MVNILDRDDKQIGNCWKCLTIIGMTEIMHGYPGDALNHFREAVNVAKRDTGSAPAWLASRVDMALQRKLQSRVNNKTRTCRKLYPELHFGRK
jgi:hypothetical protein